MKQDIDYSIDADVVVIGGGPAGFGAAVAASRRGLKVSLLESGSSIGGIMATCPGMPIGAAYPAGMSIGGILDEFFERLYATDPPAAEKRKCRLPEFGPEAFYDHGDAFRLIQSHWPRCAVWQPVWAWARRPGRRLSSALEKKRKFKT